MKKLTLALLLAASTPFASHCTNVEGEGEDVVLATAALDNAGPSLADGVRTTITSVIGAENQTFTSTGRLLVTGDKGVYELRKKSDGTYERIQLAPEQTSPYCQFGGITETRGTLYVNCYGITQSFVFAAPLADAPSFRAIYTLDGRGFANGLTSDAQGRLYIATTFQNQILRLTPSSSDPLTIAAREVFQNNAGGLTNGLAHYDGSIYWSDGAAIKRNTVDHAFATFKQVVADFAYFDDLQVDESGILAADAIGNVLRAYSLLGSPTGTSRSVFSGPSSVGRALGRAGFSQRAIVVTERSANRVSVYEPR